MSHWLLISSFNIIYLWTITKLYNKFSTNKFKHKLCINDNHVYDIVVFHRVQEESKKYKENYHFYKTLEAIQNDVRIFFK